MCFINVVFPFTQSFITTIEACICTIIHLVEMIFKLLMVMVRVWSGRYVLLLVSQVLRISG